MIRGDEADRDMRFCDALCRRLSVPFTAVYVDVPALCRTSGRSLEETARDARYNAFGQHAENNAVDFFATAHTASDNAETVIMNIIRGTTVAGLAGIPVRRGVYIRPLLNVYRADVEDYLSCIGQDFVTDSTNLVNDCTRNIIRNEVMPLLRGINPSADVAVNRLSANASDTDKLVIEAFGDTDDLRTVPSAAAFRIVKYRFTQFCGRGMLSHHASAVVEALNRNTIVGLQGGIDAVISDGTVTFRYRQPAPTVDKGVYKLQRGINTFADGSVTVHFGKKPEIGCDWCITFDASKAVGDIYYRSRAAHDRISCLGVNRSVKKTFIDKKIPSRLRASVPVFFDDMGIICVPFIGAADRIYSHREDADVISVTFSERQDLQ